MCGSLAVLHHPFRKPSTPTPCIFVLSFLAIFYFCMQCNQKCALTENPQPNPFLLILSDYDYDYYGYGDYQGGYAADPYYDDYYGGGGGRYEDYYDYGYGATPRLREPVAPRGGRAGPERVGYVAGVISSIVHH